MIQPDFDSIKQTDPYGHEFWSARDLAPLLGYKRWDTFKEAIEGALRSLEANPIPGDHISATRKKVLIGSGTEREIGDYILTRLGCYLVAQNGDSRKQEIALAQQYFAVSTRAHEIEQLRLAQEQRLEKRLKVSESYKLLAGAATDAGVESEHMGVFMDAGNLGLYEHTLEELKERKGVPESEEHLDRVGARELSAIDFKNTLATGKLQDENVEREDEAIDTHCQAGQVVREAIEKMKQPLPETLPTEPSIRKLVEERRRKQQKQRKLPSPDEQERLF
jgi:DNA-damage-inducible protein D